MHIISLAVVLVLVLSLGACGAPGAWLDSLLVATPKAVPGPKTPQIVFLRQDYEQPQRNKSIMNAPLAIGGRRFEHGIGTHSVSHIRIVSPEPISRFEAWVGVDKNDRTSAGVGSIVFYVTAGGGELYRSPVMHGGQEAKRVEIDTGGAKALDLHVSDAGDGQSCDHADWAEAAVTFLGGKKVRLDELEVGVSPIGTRYPFSFVYGGKPSDEILDGWRSEMHTEKLDADRTRTVTTWTDPATGLRVTREAVRYSDFPAIDWVLHFENTGSADTPIIENIQAADLTIASPMAQVPYILHRTNGAPSNPTDFAITEPVVDPAHPQAMSGGGGRPSNKDFPFFKVETGDGSFIFAVGWSGQWQAKLECPDQRQLHITAGLELTHFVLHPGEKVRTPRILVFDWQGDTLESNAQFRQLIYKHYCAKRNGKVPLPIPFINTCFTRGGGWLNECNAENQISLIKAYASLGIEALITDAGWFEGGWPMGAGNWNPRKDAYPQGMGPVAQAAKEHKMVYGLWFEPERVVTGTPIHREHPEWCLASQKDPQDTYLLNFGLPEVQDHFFGIVKGFMTLPGFEFYRQDFNMDPLPYWRFNDAPDRQGITEIRYIEGLYAYWDRIAKTWPGSIREECASGGRRIDLETVLRLHLHQESDYWYRNETDQSQIWGLSQYLPNNVFDTPLFELDDYSFHSTMATSLIPSWIADEPGFDSKRAKKLMDRYRELRHLLIGAWYPLLPDSRDQSNWMAMQWHRPDLNEGMILLFRRPRSPYPTADLALHGLDPKATYELAFDSSGKKLTASGKDLMKRFQPVIAEPHRSELIVYRKASR